MSWNKNETRGYNSLLQVLEELKLELNKERDCLGWCTEAQLCLTWWNWEKENSAWMSRKYFLYKFYKFAKGSGRNLVIWNHLKLDWRNHLYFLVLPRHTFSLSKKSMISLFSLIFEGFLNLVSLWNSWRYFVSLFNFKIKNKRSLEKSHQNAYYIFSPSRVHFLNCVTEAHLGTGFSLFLHLEWKCIATRVILTLEVLKAEKTLMELNQESITEGNLENSPVCGN